MASVCGPVQYSTAERFIDQLVFEAVQQQVCGVTPIVGYGRINVVFRVETTATVLIVRLNQLDHITTYQKEQWCLLQAQQHGIPVPTVLAVGCFATYAFMIQTYIPGISGADATVDTKEVWFRLGRYAAWANRIVVQGCGSAMEQHRPGMFTMTWQDMLEDIVTTIFRDDYWTQYGRLTPQQLSQIRVWIEHILHNDSPIGLCHTDIGPLNTILKHGASDNVYLLDWEMAEAAPVPAYQVASVARYWGYRSTVFQQFVRGYQEETQPIDLNDPMIKGLTALGALAIVRWAQDEQPEAVVEYTRSAQTIVTTLVEKLV